MGGGTASAVSTPKIPQLPLDRFIIYLHYADDLAKQKDVFTRLVKSLGGVRSIVVIIIIIIIIMLNLIF